MSLRAWHTYLSILVAPSVLFFALTGALQLFGLHEAHGAYRPPAIIEKLGRLHKDQVFALSEPHPHPRPAATPEPRTPRLGEPAETDDMLLRTMLLKWVFALVALALTSSTCLGAWLGLTHVKRRRTGWLLLGLGTAVPVILAFV